MESQARREAKETKGNRVLPVQLALKVLLASQVLRELMENQDLEDSRVSLAKKVMKVPVVSLDLLVQLDCRVCLVHLVRKEKQVTLDRWVPLALLVQEVHLVHQELMVHKVLQVVSEILDLWEKRVTLVNLESPAFQEKEDHRVPKVKEEKRERRVHLALLDLLVQKVLLVMTAPKEARVRLASLEILALLENLVQQVRMVPQVTREMMGSLASPDLLVQLANLVHLVLQEREVPQAQQVPKEDKEKRVQRGSQVLKVHLGRQDQSVRRGHLANLDRRVFVGYQALWVNKVFLVLLVQMVLLVRWVHLVCPASKEILVLKEKRVTRV